MNHVFSLIAAALLLLGLASPVSAEEEYEYKRVAKALSGDHIQLESGTILRYSSIVAPDLDSKDPRIKEYAMASWAFNQQLVAGKNIRVVWGAKLRDKDGVYMPYVFLEDGTFVNQRILDEGYAKLNIQPPNLEFQNELERTARFSRHERKGLWVHEDENKIKYPVIGDKMTKKFYYVDDPILTEIPKAHTEKFRSAVLAQAAGYKPSTNYRNQYEQRTQLY